ncbi:MAG: preprotein translocase subunit SecY [Rickettsia sp.]|nr:preprotein translocase subunit SecY [Rickettsia sp.]
MSNNAIKELGKKILFTLSLLFLFRLGSFIPVPGIDGIELDKIYQKSEGSVIGVLNMLSGGSLARMSVFALAIMPYITASIIVQLLSSLYTPLIEMKKEGSSGRAKLSQIARYLTLLFATFQAYGLSVGLESFGNAYGVSLITIDLKIFRFISVLTLVVGTFILMWIGEQISTKGIGNGTSLIIFVGIVVGLPKAITTLFELSRNAVMPPYVLVLVFLGVIFLISFIIFFERSQKRLLIIYPKRQVGNKLYGGDSNYMPLKINTAGVIPPIFASSILLFPSTIAAFNPNSSSKILWFFSNYLSHGKLLFILLYIVFIVFFCFFYSNIVFNVEEVAQNLKKQNAYIPGIRPGKNTADYLSSVIRRLTILGGAYLSFVCVVPEILMHQYSFSFALGGTSFLIVVNVVMDSFVQIQTSMFSSRYENLVKKMKLRK